MQLAPDMVRIYPTAVIRDTALAEAYAAGSYQPWPLDAVLDTVAGAARSFRCGRDPGDPRGAAGGGQPLAGRCHRWALTILRWASL